jgi:hypothetical protein
LLAGIDPSLTEQVGHALVGGALRSPECVFTTYESLKSGLCQFPDPIVSMPERLLKEPDAFAGEERRSDVLREAARPFLEQRRAHRHPKFDLALHDAAFLTAA